MRTHHNVDREPEPPPQGSPPVWDKPTFPVQSFPPPQPPPRPKRNRWAAIAAIVVVLALALGLGAAFVPGLVRGPGSQVTPAPTAPTAPSTRMTPTPGTATTPEPVTPGTDGVIPAPVGPGTETTPAPVPGVVLGPRACPPGIGDPARWNAIIGTNNGERQVVSISCANIMDNPSQQAMVLVRHNNANATLDVYVFNNITSSHPTRIFLLQGLIKGNARISGYNTIMTAEVDRNAAHNAGKPVSAMTPDLFREFDWSAAKGTLVQTAFPGIFPDLTRYQAEADQAQVRAGHQPWKNDAQAVSKALATTFFDWKRSITTKLLSGGGAKDVSATVLVQEAFPQGASGQGPSVRVTLSRLEGNARNMWVVIAVEDTTMLTLKNIGARSLITSPVTLEGTGAAFEAVIGRAVVYDHAYADVGHAQITGDRGMGNANYTTNVVYTTTFKAGPQEGIIAVYEANGGISDEIYTAVMRKVLLSPEPGVALGEVPCPAAVGDPAHWTPFVSKPPRIAVAERVTCGNLLDRPGLQAMVVAREIVGGGPLFRSVFIFDNITAQEPKLLFKVEHMLHGDARISGYSTIMTAEVDTSSALNKGKGDAALTVDLFREFDWSAGTGTFTQVAFPGIFPDLTRYQAEADQRLVNNGQDGWKNDATQVARAMAKQFLGWQRTLTATILSGGGSRDVDATVQVQEAALQGQGPRPSIIVTLSRLGGKTGNIWEVTGARDGTALTLTSIQPQSPVKSPVKLEGKGNAFENTIGMAYILDHQYAKAGQALVEGNSGNGMGYVPYSVQVSYTTGFTRGSQEGIVQVQLHTPIESDPATGVITKVLLDPQPRVALGPVSCPVATQQQGYWETVLALDSKTGGVGTVSCASLKGDTSLQALVPVYSSGKPGKIFVFDRITDTHPALLFSIQTDSAMISHVSTILTADIDANSVRNRGKVADQMVPDLYREFKWSAQTETFVQVVFPGLYPDLTRWQAEVDQMAVNQGKESWKLDAVQTSQHMVAALLSAHAGTAQAKLVKGGGKSDLAAVVQVTFPAERTQNIPITQVTLSRLEGNLNGIWEVTGVQADWLRLDTPTSGATISSPVTITGFGPQFEAQIGVVYILDHLYQQIQTGDNFAMAPDGASPPSRFSLPVKYTTSFKGGAQEGIVELIHGGGASFDYGATLAKVLISG